MNVLVQVNADGEWVTIHTVWAHTHEAATKKAIAWVEKVFRITSGVKVRLWLVTEQEAHSLGAWNVDAAEWASMHHGPASKV